MIRFQAVVIASAQGQAVGILRRRNQATSVAAVRPFGLQRERAGGELAQAGVFCRCGNSPRRGRAPARLRG